MKETPYELLEDDQKKNLRKNNEAKMTLYNALPRKEYERVFMCKTAKEVCHTLIITYQVGNLKVYEVILENDGVVSKTTTKNKVKSLTLKANITRGQTSNNSTCQDESDEDEEINLMAKNFRKLSRKGVKNHLADNCPKPNNKAFVRVTWSNSEDGDEPRNDATCIMAIDSQEVQPNPSISNNDSNIINLQKENQELLKFSKDFSKTYKKLLQEKRAIEKEHSKFFSKVNELKLDVKKLTSNKEVIEPCQKCVELTSKVDSLKSNVSKLQDEILNLTKFKKSSIVLDDMLNCQKLSQDKEGLGSSKNDKTTSVPFHWDP
ncbi:hypothetical protein Tco_0520228 [Tanacetum coccineum]